MSSHTVSIEKRYPANSDKIFNFFKNLTVFKLTGADLIRVDFATGGDFTLGFSGRGEISGRFIEITENEKIKAEWNVEGFGRPKETKTILNITLVEEPNACILNLKHTGIINNDSLEVKQWAWKEILDNLEKEL